VARESKTEARTGEINYLVIIFIFVGIVFFGFLNLYEPQIDQQFDFFELMFPLSEFVAGGFGLIVAKKYWGSEVFGKAYLSLGIGLILAGTGSTLFNILEISMGIANPFPNWPDIFFVLYYILLLYHLTSCIRYYNKKHNIKARESIESHKKEIDAVSAADYQRVLMWFKRSDKDDAALGVRSGERVVIEKISEQDRPLIYASNLAEERIKDVMRNTDENIYHKGFVVDVNVQMKGGKPVAYAIAHVHQIIDLPSE